MMCITCHDEYPSEQLYEINNDGDKVCLRCIFLSMLYKKYNIEKPFTSGSLMLARINARFRKIVKSEFDVDPVGTVKKYFEQEYKELVESAPKQHTEKIHTCIIDKQDFDKLEGGWPFVLVPRSDLDAKPGELLQVLEKKGDRKIERPIYAVHHMSKRQSKKYNKHFETTVFFIPPEEYYE